jgi:hypothetical protein
VTDNNVNGITLHRPELRSAVQLLSLTGFAGLLLSTSGAFDTEAAAFWPRLGYWLSVAMISTVAMEGVQRLLKGVLATPELRLRTIGLMLLILPLTAVAAVGCKLLFGGRPSVAGFVHLLPGMAGILTALQLVLFSFGSRVSNPASPPLFPAFPADPLIEALPLPLRSARLHALEAEDHYVRVHTDAGHALVRMRFADALNAVSDRAGVQPHRSWWVAQESVRAMSSRGGRTVLTLIGGQQVPVSRRARPTLGPLFASISPPAGEQR